MRNFPFSRLGSIGALHGRSRHFRCLVTALSLLVALPVLAQSGGTIDPDGLYLRSRAATCAACHGTGGRAVVPNLVPGLAGRPREELIEKMRALRGDKVGATVMPQILKGYTEAQLDELATFFAAQPR